MDPITIGLAFAAAQSAVGHIKQAIALGKDVHGLVGQFSKFFDSADSIHRARIQVKAKSLHLGKSDAELGREALEIAMHSDALRQAERELKDTIIWTLGKPELWEHMIKERTRLFKERAEAERKSKEAELAHKKKIAEQFLFGMYFIGFAIALFCMTMVGIGIYGAVEDQRIYQEKLTKAANVRFQQQRARELEEKKQLADYAKN